MGTDVDQNKDEKPKDDPKVGYFELYRFATTWDKLLVAFALLSAACVGTAQPALMVVFGDMTDNFVDGGKFAICDAKQKASYDEHICNITIKVMSDQQLEDMSNPDFYDEQVKNMMKEMNSVCLKFVFIGIAIWIFGAFQAALLTLVSTRVANRLRISYFRAIMRQDVGYFDVNSAAQMNTRLFDDIGKVQNGIGDKVGLCVQSASQVLAGIVVGFYFGWKMALVILACTPIIAATGYLYFVTTTASSKAELDSYAKAGDVAQEALSSIRTVTAFGGQESEVERYTANLALARTAGIKKHTITGLNAGLLYFVIFGVDAVAFWYGATLVIEDNYTIGTVLQVFFALLIGAFGMGAVGQNAEYFATAQAAAHSIYQVLDRKPDIDTGSEEGAKPEIVGNVEFSGIDFKYPSREEQQVLTGVSFTAEAGKTLALCGQSGCGKSTCFQLLQRFYNPMAGSIMIDGINVKDMNINWLRENIGVVSQEPVLFDTSIRENIRLGRLDVTDDEIRAALIQANAFDFIQNLPGKADTNVGTGGSTLSGGQKQRIAIARALVRNPKILLLDEATSALDTESEKLVQDALDKASKGRTTIVIAHRLSTIRNASKIIGFAGGKVVEQGTHADLIKKENGVYCNLYNMQHFTENAAASEPVAESADTRASGTSLKKDKSMTGQAEEEAKEEIEEEAYGSIIKLNKPEMWYNIFGILFALIAGSVQPFFGVVFAELLDAFGKFGCAYDDDIKNFINDDDTINSGEWDEHIVKYNTVDSCSENEMMKTVVWWCLGFVGVGVVSFIGFSMVAWLFAMSGENLTLRLRKKSFEKYLNCEMSYFDDPFNSTGALTTRLSTESAKVQGAIGGQGMAVFKSVGALGVAFTIGFYYEWRITLISLAFVPIMGVLQSLMYMVFMGEQSEKDREVFEEAGKCTTEATMNIRTVASLGREKHFVEKYEERLDEPLKANTQKAYIFGILYGLGNSCEFFMYAGVFSFAAWLIESDRLESSKFDEIFKVLFALLFGAMTAGEAGAAVPDIAQARMAASRLIQLLNRPSKIDPSKQGGQKPDKCEGRIVFKDVHFLYASREETPVLRGLTLTVEPNETVALVGQSGCGKSTMIQLVERFYDGTDGSIELDGVPINQLNVQWLRQQMGFVQQEPVLFDRTIKENVLFGTETLNKSSAKSNQIQPVSTDKHAIEKSLAEANANFVNDLPDKLATMCGKGGNQLSGGQKQRIAIARALIRQPKILLLDEATSALDTESEQIVQDALNKARNGRTVILVAHRLSTVINADKIAVVDNGKIVEIGKHDELIAKKGPYYNLVNSQMG